MHKFCLTEPECDRIQGAQKIIETFGYFPAMEGAILEEVNIKNTNRLAKRYEVCLVFDLSCEGKHTVYCYQSALTKDLRTSNHRNRHQQPSLFWLSAWSFHASDRCISHRR